MPYNKQNIVELWTISTNGYKMVNGYKTNHIPDEHLLLVSRNDQKERLNLNLKKLTRKSSNPNMKNAGSVFCWFPSIFTTVR